MTRSGRDGGSTSVETALLAPALLALIGLAVLAGRVTTAAAAVEAAAGSAAREASLARTGQQAWAAAERSARRSLAEQRLTCHSIRIDVDVSAFGRPPGTPATVRVTVSCHASVADLTLPGVPGARRLAADAVSPLDTYRGRAP